MLKKLTLASLALGPQFAHATLPVGQVPPAITLKGDKGGTVDGKPWSSNDMKGKVTLLVYSTVGEKDTNDAAAKAVKAMNCNRDQFTSVAVINMKGSWEPNFIIDSALKGKQEEFPETLYVRDLDHVLVKQWKIADKSNNLVLFDKDLNVVFIEEGEAKKPRIDELTKQISTRATCGEAKNADNKKEEKPNK